jgi:uncharacterized protein YecE (DUF72 family)
MADHVVRIGCSGWSYAHWRGPVYHGRPAREWLGLYAGLFDTVEVNATFYRLPRRRTVESWAEGTPDGFRFAVKTSRYLTHVRRLSGVRAGWSRMFSRVEPLAEAAKLAAVLWQLPPTFPRDDARLAAALHQLPQGYRHCFEFRHASWFCPEVLDVLRRAGAGLVIGDDPSRPFQLHEVTSDLVYLRLHRGSRGRRGNYAPSELAEWAQRVRLWAQDGDVVVYFNNDWEGFAVRNALRLRELLGAAEPAPLVV